MLNKNRNFLFFTIFFAKFAIRKAFAASYSVLNMCGNKLQIIFFFNGKQIFSQKNRIGTARKSNQNRVAVSEHMIFFNGLRDFIIHIFYQRI